MDTPRIVLKPSSLFLNPKPNNCFMDTPRIVRKPKGAVDRARMSHDKERWKQPIFAWFLLLFLCPTISAQTWDGVVVTQVDFQALQAFKQELMDPKGFLRSWNDSGFGACSGGWSGIKCAKGQVIVIQLPWRGLAGRISDKIGQLQALRKLSLHDNLIGGQIPATMGLLPSLRGVQLFNNLLSGSVPPSLGLCPLLQTIDLSNNSLAGEVPDGLGSSEKLHWLNLSFNSLTGKVPASLNRSSSLAFLALQHNNLSGSIPDGLGKLSGLRSLDLSWNDLVGEIPVSLENLQNLTSFSVAHNNLSGAVPAGLVQKFSPSAFAGNVQLCGYGVSAPCPTQAPSQVVHAPPGQEPKRRRHRLSTKDIILIAAGVLILLVLVLCCALLFCLLRRRNGDGKAPGGGEGRVEKGREPVAEEAESGGKLVHFDGQMAFTADDLLCATAEIMGKSTYGTVYRATLEGGGQVAVKRLREKMSKGQSEFENEVNYLGRIRHPNLLPMRAYYLGPKGEKLLVFDYLPNGSLAAFLHARETDNTPIDWDTRKNIARGVARGLFHLHAHESIIHGNLTSSNVLIHDDSSAKISDFGLSRLMTAAANSNVIATAGALGYRAPELSKLKNVNAKSDVYSLGVIMLELLTGKSPGEAINGLDLPRWVASVVKEEWTNEVFDVELMSDVNANIGDELLNMLKLGLHCVDPSPTVRPELEQVLRQLENIRPEMSTSSGDDAAAGPSASH